MKTTMARDIVGHPPACLSGWRPAHDWSFNQSFAPVYQLVTPGDVSAHYSPGMRFRCVNGGMTKYFIVVACAYVAPYGVTNLYLYGGTDYTLGVGITDEMYSTDAYPLGFPADPRKWSVTVTDTSNRSQSAPTANEWYNLGGVSIDIPYGLWQVRYEVNARCSAGTDATISSVYTCLSTTLGGTGAPPIPRLANVSFLNAAAFTGLYLLHLHAGQDVVKQANLNPTTYYLLSRTAHDGMQSIQNRGDGRATVIEARCAYL